MEHMHMHGAPVHTNGDKVTQQLKTARGQMDGIIKMYEENRYCVDISKQILAVVSILRNANILLLNDHLNSCVTEAIQENRGQEKIEEIIDILSKYYK